MAKHYEIDNEKKIIYADIMALTEKEEAEVAKFQKYGYDVENKVKEKAKISRLDDAYILSYLEALDDEEAVAQAKKTYDEKKNLPAVDEHGEKKKTVKGTVKRQGFNAGRNWFARIYPLDVNVAIEAIRKENMTKALEDAYSKYEKKVQKAQKEAEEKGETLNETPMTKDEYTKDFYWKKVFENPQKKNKK